MFDGSGSRGPLTTPQTHPKCCQKTIKRCHVFGNLLVRAVDLTTRLRKVIGTPGARLRFALRAFFGKKQHLLK